MINLFDLPHTLTVAVGHEQLIHSTQIFLALSQRVRSNELDVLSGEFEEHLNVVILSFLDRDAELFEPDEEAHQGLAGFQSRLRIILRQFDLKADRRDQVVSRLRGAAPALVVAAEGLQSSFPLRI